MNKIGFVGGRTFIMTYLAEEVIRNSILTEGPFICVSGGATGADEICASICKELTGIEPIIYKPNWNKYGKSAGYIRNSKIIDESDSLVAFWDGKSRGTADSIQKAENKGIPVIVIKYDNEVNHNTAMECRFHDIINILNNI